MDLDAIFARLERLERERAIARVIHDYCHFIDYGEKERWLDLFTRDAVYELHYREGAQAPQYGSQRMAGNRIVYDRRDLLEDFIQAHPSAPELYHKHVVADLVIDWEDEVAQCQSYFLRVDDRNSPVIVAMGRYLDEIVLEEDGKWRFRSRIAEIESRAPA